MNEHLLNICVALDELSSVILNAWPHDTSLREYYGWHHPALSRHDLAGMASNLSEKLKKTSIKPFDSVEMYKLESIPIKLKSLHADTIPYMFNGNGTQAIPAYIATIAWIDSLFQQETDWETLQDKDLLPTKLSARLKNIKSRLDIIENSNEILQQKITVINEAHDAAENLPTTLDELEAAKEQLKLINESAENHSSKMKKEITDIYEEIVHLKNLSKTAQEKSETFKAQADDYAKRVTYPPKPKP
jgi:DNA repair exonuclease SbcCD ATPase subunit